MLKLLDKAPILVFPLVGIPAALGFWIWYKIEQSGFQIGEYVTSVFIAVVFVFIVSILWGNIWGALTRDWENSRNAGWAVAVYTCGLMVLLALIEPILLWAFGW